jgi:signal transduction histidine kinase
MALFWLTRRLRDLWIAQPVTLLVIAVVVPAACVLWFMNEAIRNQTALTERSMADLYRSQLRSLRGRVAAEWEARASSLDSGLTGNAQADFQRLVTTRATDAVVLTESDGRARYPSLAAWFGTDLPGTEWWAAARMHQAVIPELMQSNRRLEAIASLEVLLSQPLASKATPGRSVVADAYLLLLELLPAGDSRRTPAISALTALVNDYARTSLPSAQRAFVMGELAELGVDRASLPTLEAERLALAFLESEPTTRTSVGLRSTALDDAWQLSSPTGRVVALYRTETVKRVIDEVLHAGATANVAFASVAPGEATDDEAVLVGEALPGWSMTFVVQESVAAGQHALVRRNDYITAALLAIGLIAAAVAVVVGGVRREAQMVALKTDLVSTVSHELKTPLASMRLLVDSLLEDGDLNALKTREYLKLMAGENQRLTKLVENFLTFSKLERGRYQFTFSPTSAADVVRESVAALPEDRRNTRPPQITIEPGLPPLRADRDALVTVLLNLLDNAYKYSSLDGRVAIRVFRQRRAVVFAVDDHGVGIPAREHRRIFRWFYRVDAEGASAAPGTGLGLSIVRAIARAHGGHVRVRSEPTQGTTFEVAVPAAPEA